MTTTKSDKEIRSSYYGAGLLLVTIVVFFILPLLNDKIINYLSYLVYGILRVGAIFYGQTTVKKLNKNYTFWTVVLFFFPAISLIALGQLDKTKMEMLLIKLDPTANSKNVNNLPSLTLGTESNMLKDSLMNDVFTLKYMINHYKNYIKESTSLFPILAAYHLNGKDVAFDGEIQISLDKFAKEKGNNSFGELLSHLKAMTPEEICKTFI
jgi:hypothetical protein